MKRLALLLIVSVLKLALLLSPVSGADRWEARAARQKRKQYEAQIGVTTLKWQTRKYRAKTAANITSPLTLINPINWIFR